MLTEIFNIKKLSGLQRDFGVGIFLQMLQVGASFVTAIFLARLLEPEGYGIYTYTISFLTLLTIPVQSGLPILAVREIAQARAQRDWGKLKGAMIWIFVVSAGMIVVMILIGVLIRAAGSTRIAVLDASTTFWALIMLPFWVWGKLGGATLRGLGKVQSGILCQEVLRPALLAVLILASFLIGVMLAPPSAMALHAFAAIIAFLAAMLLLYRAFPREARTAKPIFFNRTWGLSILPLALLGGMQMINQNASLVILGVMTNPEDVGLYRVAVQIAALIEIGLYVANLALAPRFSTLYAQNRLKELQRLATRSARAVFVMSLLIIAFVLVFGQLMLRLVFGQAYVPAYVLTIPLIIAEIINVFFGSVGTILNMSGHERYTATGVSIAAIVNILANIALIPVLGALGAGIASAISMLIWNIILWRFLLNTLGIDSTILARG
jgi:O-antigen/teichoic acid export membrane protein